MSSGASRYGAAARRLAFAAGFFLAILLAAEVLLRPLHLERYDPRFLIRSSFPLFVPGEGQWAGRYVTNGHFWQSLNFQSFSARRSPGTRRVFVLGGSAAYGWPSMDVTSFAGYLRRALELRYPGIYEVVNAAGMSYGSHRILDFLRDVTAFQPDLVIIYCGNNEFVERNSLPPGEYRGRWLRWLRDRLSGLHLYRALRLVLARAPLTRMAFAPRGPDVTDPRVNPAVNRFESAPAGHLLREVTENYRRNLEAMAELLHSRGIPGVFCTVPVNLRDWVPTGQPPAFADAATFASWSRLVSQGTELLARDPSGAARLLREALSLAPGWAPAEYHLARALEASGDYREADRLFRLARDHDAKPSRATETFNGIVRDVARRPGINLVDLEQIFAAASPHGLIGSDLIPDYCHPNPRGHRLAAVALLPFIPPGAAPIDVAAVSRLIEQDDAETHRDLATLVNESYALGMVRGNNGDIDAAERHYRDVLALEPTHTYALSNLAGIALLRGRRAEARELLDRALASDPQNIDAHFSAGLLAMDQGDTAAGQRSMLRVLELNPRHADALQALGDMAAGRGDAVSALSYYDRSLSLGVDNAPLRFERAKVLIRLGRVEDARADLQRVLAFDPQNAEAARLLAAKP